MSEEASSPHARSPEPAGDSPPQEPFRALRATAACTGARFIGKATIAREGDEIVITGPRAGASVYLVWLWACILMVCALLAWGLWWPSRSTLPGLVLALLLTATWAGGLLLMGYHSKASEVRMRLTAVRELAVGFRPRVWHVVLLLLTSGLAVLFFIPMYRGRHRTVSFLGDDGEGDPVRYRFEAADETEAIRLAALLLNDTV
jgi:hypothetical protein